MKRLLFWLMTCCMMLAAGLSGCQTQDSTGEDIKSENGAPAVDADEEIQNQEIDYTDGDPAVRKKAQSEGVLEIEEEMFVELVSEIQYNFPEYLGRTIRYEGIFKMNVHPETGEEHAIVFRHGPKCCESDESFGFEVSWDQPYPNENDWVEVIGVLEQYGEEGYEELRIALSSMQVLSTRGAETVR